MDPLEPRPELYNVPWATTAFNDMPYRRIGASGLMAGNVGLGTWKIGYPDTGDGARVDEAGAFAIFDRALELGVTFWDTANRYNGASGNSERIIGKWLRQNPDQRRNIVLATKICGGMDGRTPNHSGLSRINILESVYACLDRLQIDCLDLLYFHAFDPRVPVEESLSAVEDLVRSDEVRYLGVSNFTGDQLALYRAAEASATVRARVVAVQNQFDIVNGEAAAQRGTLDYAAANNISFVAWSPLARGLLTDRYLEPGKAGPGDRLFDEGTLSKDVANGKIDKVRALAKLARDWDMALSELAIAYTLTLPGMGPVIASVSNPDQLASNARGGRIELTAEQRQSVQTVLGGS